MKNYKLYRYFLRKKCKKVPATCYFILFTIQMSKSYLFHLLEDHIYKFYLQYLHTQIKTNIHNYKHI